MSPAAAATAVKIRGLEADLAAYRAAVEHLASQLPDDANNGAGVCPEHLDLSTHCDFCTECRSHSTHKRSCPEHRAERANVAYAAHMEAFR